MGNYLDEHIIQNLSDQVAGMLRENTQFAIQRVEQDDPDIPAEDLKQIMQDVAEELLDPLVRAVIVASQKTLGIPDYPAIAQIFEGLGIRARLEEIRARDGYPLVDIKTRHGVITGIVFEIDDYEGQESVRVHVEGQDQYLPLSTILAVVDNQA